MGQKRTPHLVTIAKRLQKGGSSLQEIADELSKKGEKVSKASVANWLRDPVTGSSAPATAVQASPASSATPVQAELRPGASPSAALPIEPAAPDAPAGAAMTPDEVVRWLSDAIRDCQELAEACKNAGDGPGQARAIRLATQLAAPMARLQARTVDEGDVVRVKAGDIQAAADRAVLALHNLADRVVAERATWPKCGHCGSHFGAFPSADVSPLRALFERVARPG